MKNENPILENAPPITLVLVSCVSQKLTIAARAKNLYVSNWFQKARAYAERVGDAWSILSALHELLDPETIVKPYNRRLQAMTKIEREAWAGRIAERLFEEVPPGSRIIVLAGRIYREFLVKKLADNFEIAVPMAGLGIGRQISYLKKANQIMTHREAEGK